MDTFQVRTFVDPFTNETYNPKTKLLARPVIPLSIRAQILNHVLSDFDVQKAVRELLVSNYESIRDTLEMTPDNFKVALLP